MSNNHPNTEDFKDLLDGRSRPGSRAGNARVVRHLMADFPDSRELIHAAGWDGCRLQRLLLLPKGSAEPEQGRSDFDYGPAFLGAELALTDFLSPGRPASISSAELLAELAQLPEEERISLVTSEERYAAPELVTALIEHSHSLRFEDPAPMLHWAHLARIAADCSTTEGAGSQARLADLRTRAWGHFGNSLRVCGRLREAEEALSIAQRFAQRGTGDPLLKARLLEQLASLHIFQRRFEKAIRLAEEAGRLYQEIDQTHRWAGSQVTLAMAHIYAQEPDEAVKILNQAIPAIDPMEDPHLLVAACHNLVVCFINLGMPEQALALYSDTRSLDNDLDDTLIRLRFNWQEGQLLRDLGRLENAEEVLIKVREGFKNRGLAYEVAVVSLDLAAVYVKLSLVEEVRETVAEALPTFRALQVDREIIASLLQLQQVADQEVKALNLIRAISARLEQSPGRFRNSL